MNYKLSAYTPIWLLESTENGNVTAVLAATLSTVTYFDMWARDYYLEQQWPNSPNKKAWMIFAFDASSDLIVKYNRIGISISALEIIK